MRPTSGIRERIDQVYPSLRPAERSVARYVRDHLDQPTLTVGQLAEAAGVSQPTVIRVARKLGFDGYRELRYALEHPTSAHSSTFNPLEGFDLNPWDNIDDVPAKAAHGAKALIDELTAALDTRSLRKAIDLITGARLIDIYAVENSLAPATDLATKLGYLGLHCRLNVDAYMQQIGAGHLSADDVAIALSHSGSSADTVKAMRLAKSRGANTIAVTNTMGVPLTKWADVTLLTGRGMHTIYGNAIFSRVANMVMIDMIYMGVILSDYARFSTALDESGRMIRDRVFHD